MVSLESPIRQLVTLDKAPWSRIDETSKNGFHRSKVNWITVFNSFIELQELWPKINKTPIHHKNVTLTLRVQRQSDLDQLRDIVKFQKYFGCFALCCQPLEKIDLTESLRSWPQIDWVLAIQPEKPPQLNWLHEIYNQVRSTDTPLFFDIREWYELTEHVTSSYDNLPRWLCVHQLMKPDIENEGYIIGW